MKPSDTATKGLQYTVAKRKFHGIELLRGVLALLVALYHYLYYGPITEQTPSADPAGHWLAYGRFAVSAFFVISGYLIAISASQSTALRFAVNRFARLWPSIAICATITFSAYFLTSAEPKGTAEWLRSALLLPLIQPGKAIDSSYWSISYELRFYVTIAILILFGLARRSMELITLIGLATLGMYSVTGNSMILSMLAFPHLGFFGLGIVLHRIRFGEGLGLLTGLMLAANLLAASCGAYLNFERVDMFDGFRSAPIVGLAISAAAMGVVVLAERVTLSGPAIPIALVSGAISYPFYLLHQDLGYLIINRLDDFFPIWIAQLMAISGILLLSYAIYRVVEQPGVPFVRASLVALTGRIQILFARAVNWRQRRLEIRSRNL